MRNAGYEVSTATDGEEALDVCISEGPDLIITDYQMPIMSGLDLCRKLRETDGCRSIPAIMLTAHGFDISAEEMAEVGIAAVLAKPFSPREVLEQVTQHLGRPEPLHVGGEK